jgi:hypothetical protein
MSLLQEKGESPEEHAAVEEEERAAFDPAPEVAPPVPVGICV